MTTSRWKPGQSGNPAGRTPGSGEVGRLRASIAEHVPTIIEKLVEQARAGDVGAARLLVERVIPPLKPGELSAPIALPQGTLADQGRAVLTAAGDGTLAPGQAAQMLAGLSSLAKLIESDELEARIRALEQQRQFGFNSLR